MGSLESGPEKQIVTDIRNYQPAADVLQVLVCGNSDKTIARQLGIGVGTVKGHMKQLFHKLGVSTRTQVVIRAMDLGMHETPARH